jgi:hypothetical protein
MHVKSSIVCPSCHSEIQRPSGLRRKFACQTCGTKLELDNSEALKSIYALELITVVVVLFVTFKIGIVVSVLAFMFGVAVYVVKLRAAPVVMNKKSNGPGYN